MLEHEWWLRPVVALLAGALVGLERSYHGRAAGLRTYALVCLGSALLVTLAEQLEPAGDPSGSTRVIQGIVTGIGFLGAGVIIREGFSVRGLTTAASIWVIAVIGVVFGAGLYIVGVVGTIVTWIALEILRRLETRVPVLSLVHCEIELPRRSAGDQRTVCTFVEERGFKVGEISYGLDRDAQTVTYELVMWSKDSRAPSALEQGLLAREEVLGFRVR